MEHTDSQEDDRSKGINRNVRRSQRLSIQKGDTDSRQSPKSSSQGSSPIGFERFDTKYRKRGERRISSELYPRLDDTESDSEQNSTSAESPSPSDAGSPSAYFEGDSTGPYSRLLPRGEYVKQDPLSTSTLRSYPYLEQQQVPPTFTKTVLECPRSHEDFSFRPWIVRLTSFWPWIVGLLVCVCFFYPDLSSRFLRQYANEENTNLIKYQQGISFMKSGLSHQNPTIWKRLNSIGTHRLVKNLTQPAVLPVLLPHDSWAMGDCFIELFKEVACRVTPCNHHPIFDYNYDGDLHSHLNRALSRGGTVWGMKNFELIRSQDAIQFLSYADHEHAPYKHAIIVILVRTEEPSWKVGRGNMDEHVERALEASLQDKVKLDKITAIVSRLSGYGIILKKDEDYERYGCPTIS